METETTSVPPKNFRFLALGDSYTIGEQVLPNERWPVQLVHSLQQQKIDISNPTIVATTGWTTDELMAGIAKASPQGPYDLVSLLIGVNNQYRQWDIEKYRVEFAQLLRQAIDFAGGDPAKVIVFSIPDWGVTPFAKGQNSAKIAKEIDAYNAINLSQAKEQGCHYIDVTPISRQASDDFSLLATDGLHPSGKMYKAWVELAVPVAKKALKLTH